MEMFEDRKKLQNLRAIYDVLSTQHNLLIEGGHDKARKSKDDFQDSSSGC